MGQDYYGCDGAELETLERAYWDDTTAGEVEEARQLEFDFEPETIPF